MTTLKLIGTYRVTVSDEELRFITESVTGSADTTQEEIGNLALLEIEVCVARGDFDICWFSQVGSDQTPYDERYFSADGLQFLGWDRPDAQDFRVCFFLHFFDAAKSVTSPLGDLTPSGLSEMPERLAKHCNYEHPG